ncbi:hypothetical protein [Cloacibacillus sp. An23]|uniref:hypothetical protein n=1 Tax=Cloacibacillus sp. An23 TaxID=1965591 RepID=UPI000B3A6396|nr:hypothetical protein [Cloacibacillus sp. An23]OUO92956.1 hypothetical protein B5F39_08865 [Cloacibacillus sp. An23]
MAKAARFFAASLTLALAALFAFVPFLCAGRAIAAQKRVRIAVTSPWLLETASFICGDRASVRALAVLEADGRERLVSRPARGEVVIAFDAADASRHRISAKNSNLALLFDMVQVSEEKLRRAFFDPAMLPFIAQEIMKAVSKIDPESYAYYQRRLAEFQSRIDSAVGVGRHLSAGGASKALDLTGAEGVWLRSSIEGIVRPPDGVWNGWLSGDGAALSAALDEAARRGWLLLLDPWTPETIRAAAAAYPNRMTLPPPSGDGDIFVFLHDILTSVAARLGAEKPSQK